MTDPQIPYSASVKNQRLSALPSVGVRIAAFLSICLSGLAGGVIGYALVSLQCEGECGVPIGSGILAGSLTGTIGMAVVAVLVMRALGEWREAQDSKSAGPPSSDPV